MSYSSDVLADAPLAYWRLGESSGTVTSDSSGNGRDGSYINTPTLGEPGLLVGDANTAVQFVAAQSERVDVANAAWMDTASATIECLVKLTTAGQTNRGLFTRFGSTSQSSWLIWVDTAGKIAVRFYNAAGTAYNLSWATTPSAGVPYHVAATFSAGGGGAVLYVNGSQVASASTAGNLRAPTTNIGFQLGAYASVSYLDGTIDEAAYYGTALSAARVLAHYDAALGAGGVTGNATGSGVASADTVAVHTADAAATGSGVASAAVDGGAVPEVVAAATGSGLATAVIETLLPSRTDTSNRVGGRRRSGMAVATWEPPVEAPPATTAPTYARDVLLVPGAVPTVVAGRPTLDMVKVEKVRHRDRILVGGKDITFFRGVPTPTPAYRLVEPLTYGAGTLTIPQVSPAFERLGVGPLKWVRKGAQVVVQRVNAAGVVVAKDYHGFVDEIQMQGNTLVLALSGRVSGRLALQDRQPPLFREAADAGLWAAIVLRKHANVSVRPFFGPKTGIDIVARGGGSMLDYTYELLSMSTTRGGAQWTISESADGTWTMHLKDRTTIDATVYFDDAMVVADLHNSLAEEPNRIYASGVAPDGRRIKNAKYPGLRQAEPPRYPFINESTTFGAGTTNESTDFPELGLMTVYKSRLHTMGYLPQHVGSTYTDLWAEAVEDLQAAAGLPETGVTDLATWRAAFDLSATGYSLRFSRIEPMAQHPAVKPWHLSGSGAIIGRNASFNPHAPPVDRSIDVGVGFTRKQVRGAARRIIRESQSTKNWVGTVKFSGDGVNKAGTMALIAGGHVVGTPVTAADLMPARALRAGMNVWAPLFDGGTLFHVSGVSVSEGGDVVEAMLDTRARDTMAAWEVIARNRESRTNLARAWLNVNRTSRMPEDFIEWDDVAGVIEENVAVDQGRWTVFPVVAGQEGTVAKMRMTLEPARRFSVMVFARKPPARLLDALFPQPLSNPDDGEFDKPSKRQWLDDHGFVFSAGTGEWPCGHFPHKPKFDDENNPIAMPVTGKWEDDASFGYYTQGAPVLWVAVWTFEGDAEVQAGRIMWNQLEGGVT